MVTMAPMDQGLPTLSVVLDPRRMREHLARALPTRYGAARDLELRVLKHHPGRRCTLDIAITMPRGSSALISKVYAADRSDVFRVMARIWQSGFGRGEELSIPEPIGYLPELRLLLLEKVEGPRAKLIFTGEEDGEPTEVAGRAARWLARFQRLAPAMGRTADVSEHLEDVDRWSQGIARLGEPFRTLAARLARRLHAEAPGGRGDLCAGHGSYQCHQIILARGRTAVVDWDGFDVAHPSRDVARFAVALQRLAVKYFGSIQALDRAVDVFLQTYRAHSPYDITASLAWYRALACFRLAKYEANRPVCTFPEGIEALLGEGLRVLEGDAS